MSGGGGVALCPLSFNIPVQGDSGGPLTVESVGGQTLAGIVSHGDPAGCGKVRKSEEHYELNCLMSRGAGMMSTQKFPTILVGFMRLF